jgi:hypothetical protein
LHGVDPISSTRSAAPGWTEIRIIMNLGKPLPTAWCGVTNRLESTWDPSFRGLAEDWVATITLKDHYVERRLSS